MAHRQALTKEDYKLDRSTSLIGFIGIHLACFGAIWTGFPAEAVALGVALYVIRVFGITAGFHRYFSHRTFKTSRVFQFLLAFMGQMSLQRGVIWWAAKHREHHRDSDTVEDAHSPLQHGFFFSHMGWVFNSKLSEADYDKVPDITQYPELVWLDKHKYMPGVLLGFACWLAMGWAGLVVGFFWSTVAVYHATFAINSLAHVFGRARYLTGDESKNSAILAFFAMGEGWHNNHHYCMASTRQGFKWWEFDMTYMILRVLAVFGIVWDIKEPPAHMVKGERQLSDQLLDRLGEMVAMRFPVEDIIQRVRDRLSSNQVDDVTAVVQEALPSPDEIHSTASRFLARTEELKDVAVRAHRHLANTVSEKIANQESFVAKAA